MWRSVWVQSGAGSTPFCTLFGLLSCIWGFLSPSPGCQSRQLSSPWAGDQLVAWNIAALVTNSLATSWKVKVNIVTSLRRLLPNVHKHQDGASPAAWLNLLNMVKMGGHWLEVSQLLESWVSAASQHLYLPLLTWYPTSSACWSNIVTTSKYLHTIHAPTEDHGATLQEASHLARYLETFKW